MNAQLGLDRLQLLKPVVALAGWTFVQEVCLLQYWQLPRTNTFSLGLDVRDADTGVNQVQRQSG